MSDRTPAQPPRKGRKGPRPRHVPVRTCVVCRGQAAKRGLVRIVRTPERSVQIDETGRLNGRGAYLCDKPLCWERAAKSDVLAKALNVELTDELRDDLRRYAAEHLAAGATGSQSGK